MAGSDRISEGATSPGRETRDEYVEIPTYVEPVSAGLTNRQKLFYHGSGIGVGLLLAAVAYGSWRYFGGEEQVTTTPPVPQRTTSSAPAPSSVPASTASTPNPDITEFTDTPLPRAHHARASAGADVIAAAKQASGLMYVHRNNSDLRPAPSTSSEPIRKLAKGEKVQLLMLSDKWAEVDDAGTKGWMRASVLKDTPPGEKKPRKKKSDDE
jgi:hypothetical protein